jgi:hypothetical protein
MNTTRHLQEVTEEINTQRAASPATRTMLPPGYGDPQRDAINSVVDNVVQDISRKIDDLRKQLDALEQQVLVGAAKSKLALHGQIQVCVRVNDEITHMGAVIEEIAASQPTE